MYSFWKWNEIQQVNELYAKQERICSLLSAKTSPEEDQLDKRYKRSLVAYTALGAFAAVGAYCALAIPFRFVKIRFAPIAFMTFYGGNGGLYWGYKRRYPQMLHDRILLPDKSSYFAERMKPVILKEMPESFIANQIRDAQAC